MAFSWFKKKQESPEGPVFNEIDSPAKAQAAHKRRELSMIYLFPLVFGGEEAEINSLYVPEFAAMLKERFDNMVVDLFEKGLVTGYSASPEYKGQSVVPSALVLEAKGKGGITERIEVW